MTPTLAVTADPNRVIGYRANGSPIWLHMGADNWSQMFAEPDTDGDGDADDEPDDDDEGDDDSGTATTATYTPPTQEEWDRLQGAVKRNNAENKQHRLLKKALEARNIDVSTEEGRAALDDLLNGRAPVADGSTGGDQTKRDAQRAAERAAAKVEAKYKPALAKAAAQAALTSAGWSGTASELARALKMIDLEDVDVDGDGNVTGIDDQIAEIKADIPSWFKAGEKPVGERRRGAAEVDGGDRATKTTGTGTWLDKVDRQMTGG